MSDRSPSRPTGRRRKPAARGGVQAAGGLFEPGQDLAVTEQLMVTLAAHPAGAGFQRVRLLVWNPDRHRFEDRASAVASASPRTLEQAMRSGRRAVARVPDGSDLTFEPADFGEALRRVWLAGRCGRLEPAGCGLPWIKAEEVGAVALRHGARPFGLLLGEWDEAGSAAERSAAIEGLRSVINAALAAHATADAARRHEWRALALSSFARATVSAHNLAEVTDLLVRLACEGTGARGAALWRRSSQRLELVGCYGPAGTRDRIGRGMHPLAVACERAGRPIRVERASEDALLPTEIAAQLSTATAVPLIAFGRPHGVLAVYDRVAPHPGDGMGFDPEDVRFLHGLADLGAMAFTEAESEDNRRQAEQARRDLLHYLDRRERLADVGEMAMQMAHDARNPLASIGAFARRVHRGLAENDPHREYLEVVIREAERLEHSIAVPLERAVLEPPRLRVESVNVLIQAALEGLAEQLVRRRIRLLKKLTPDLPGLLLDVERLGHVFANVLADALDRVSAGGRIRVESRRVQHFVVVEISNDGHTEPGGAVKDLFVPFQLRGGARAEAGLAMARQVVEQHGGEVRVRTEGEWSTVFVLTLPVRENQDRRGIANRRVVHTDRRQRAPAR